MPNPSFQLPRWPHVPLLEHIRNCTHVRIKCRCGRWADWRTEDLVTRCPGAVTCSDFHSRLRCAGKGGCGLTGWVTIHAITR